MELYKNNPIICIIVLNYNDYNMTKKYIASWQFNLSDSRIRLIVVDNNSLDNSYEKLKEEFLDKIDVIKTEENRGYAYGNNFGYKYAYKKYKPEICIISNPDIIVKKDVVFELCHTFKEDNKIAIVGCKVVNLDNSVQRYAWKLPCYSYEVLSSFALINNLFLKNKLLYSVDDLKNDLMECEVVTGAFFAVRTDVFNENGIFDEDTFLYCEEQILGYKLKRQGYMAVVRNDLQCCHIGSVSIKKEFKKRINTFVLHQRSKRVYLKKYLGVSKVKLFIFDFICKVSYLEKNILFRLLGE